MTENVNHCAGNARDQPTRHFLSRREALGLGLTALATMSLPSRILAHPGGRVDIHHHWHPPPIKGVYEGARKLASWPGGDWSPVRALEVLDRFNIQTAVLSCRNPLSQVGVELTREVNEASARVVSDHPERFGAFAMLPQFDFDAAVAEAVYALDTLKLDGVRLSSSAGNHYLGDSQYDTLMAELNSRSAIVLLHADSPFYFKDLNLNFRSSLLEYIFDMTRAIANLVITGSIERYPDIRFIMAYAGGAAPYIAARLHDMGERHDPRLRERAPQGVLHYLSTFYYDTSQSVSPYAFGSLLELVDSSQILFGTDLPVPPPSEVELYDQTLLERVGLTSKELDDIERGNALRLFPRLAKLAVG